MPCYTTPDGRGIVCVRGRGAPAPCRWCGQPSTRLCDEPVRVVFGEPARTCDAPVCDAHRTAVGASLDRCPDHAPVAVPA